MLTAMTIVGHQPMGDFLNSGATPDDASLQSLDGFAGRIPAYLGF